MKKPVLVTYDLTFAGLTDFSSVSLKDELKPNVSALLQQIALSEGTLLVTKIQDPAALTELISRGLVVIKGAYVYVDWIHVPKK